MNDELLRFLELARRELGAEDARAEIGGRPPRAKNEIFCEVSSDSRIVVVLADARMADLSLLKGKLERLVDAFLSGSSPPSIAPTRGSKDPTQHSRLQAALEQLVERSGARVAAVLDQTSPVLWGSTLSTDSSADVETLIASASDILFESATDAQLVGKAAAAFRDTETPATDGPLTNHGASVLLRRFAGIYALVLGYGAQASPLRAESAARKAQPHIEQLVLALPPLDPEPEGKKVLSFIRPFRVVR